MKFRPQMTSLALLAAFFSFSGPSVALAQRPSAMKLFPEETLAFVRVAHGMDFVERFRTTGFGQLLRGPELQPLVNDAWQLAGDRYQEDARERVGIDWDDLSRLPKGELAVGIVPRGGTRPGVLLLADFDGEEEDADFFADRLRERWETEGRVVEETEIDGDTLIVVRRGENRNTSFGYLFKETCLLASNDETLLRELLDRWKGRATGTLDAEGEEGTSGLALADKKEFVDILRECSTQLEEPPQLVFYADPLGLLRHFTRGNPGMAVVMATFPQLGLDGILGVGGTVSLASERWEGLTHLHLLLDNPRSGVLTLLRFKEGEIAPPSYVPADVYGYGTMHADVPGIFERLNQLVDKFRYDGSFRDSIEQGPWSRFDVDLEEDLINNLAGRMVLVTSYDVPRRLQGEMRAIGLTLVDPQITRDALESVVEQLPERMEKREFGGVEYVAMAPRFGADLPEEERPFSPAICILDDTLIFSSSTSLLEQMLAAHQGTNQALADSVGFKVIQSRVERMTRGQKLATFNYENPAMAFRHWFELAQDDRLRDRLAEGGANSPFLASISQILEDNQLPSGETLDKALSPTGGYLLDTNTGLHYMNFSIRRGASE